MQLLKLLKPSMLYIGSNKRKRKMKNLFLIVAILASSLFISCNNDDDFSSVPINRKNYIRSYLHNIESIYISDYKFDESFIGFGIRGEDTKEGESLFNKLAKQYNDENFNNNYGCNYGEPVLSDTILKIDVFANKDIEGIKTGESLSSIITIKYKSYDKILKSNYDRSIDAVSVFNLSDFNSSKKILFDAIFYLKFEKKFETENILFTLNITTNNKEISSSFEIK